MAPHLIDLDVTSAWRRSLRPAISTTGGHGLRSTTFELSASTAFLTPRWSDAVGSYAPAGTTSAVTRFTARARAAIISRALGTRRRSVP